MLAITGIIAILILQGTLLAGALAGLVFVARRIFREGPSHDDEPPS